MRARAWSSSVCTFTWALVKLRARHAERLDRHRESARSSAARRSRPACRTRAGPGSGEISFANATSWSVTPAMAETTTTTSLPRFCVSTTRRATLRMRSTPRRRRCRRTSGRSRPSRFEFLRSFLRARSPAPRAGARASSPPARLDADLEALRRKHLGEALGPLDDQHAARRRTGRRSRRRAGERSFLPDRNPRVEARPGPGTRPRTKVGLVTAASRGSTPRPSRQALHEAGLAGAERAREQPPRRRRAGARRARGRAPGLRRRYGNGTSVPGSSARARRRPAPATPPEAAPASSRGETAQRGTEIARQPVQVHAEPRRVPGREAAREQRAEQRPPARRPSRPRPGPARRSG